MANGRRALTKCIVLLASLVLAACGGTVTPSGTPGTAPAGSSGGASSPAAGGEKITLTVEMSVYVEAPHKAAFDALKAAYEKAHPNITIVYRGAAYADFWDKLTTEISAGTEADIVQLQDGGARYASYAALRPGDTGAFVNLDPYIKGTKWENVLVGQKDLVYNGHYIGISDYAWGARGIFYRKSQLQAAGIDPSSIKTIDDLQSAMIKLTKPGNPQQYGLCATLSTHPFVANEWETTLARPMAGGVFFKGEQGPFTPDKLIVDSPDVVAAAQLWQDWVYKDKVSPIGQEKAGVRDLFWAGRCAFNIDGPWFTGMTAAKDPALLSDIGIIATPAVNYNGKLRYQPGDTYAITNLISSKSKHPDEAWKFLEWMLTPEAQQLVALSGMIPSNTEYSKSPNYVSAEPLNSLFPQFLAGYAPGMSDPNIPQAAALNTIMVEAAQAMFINGAPVQETLHNARIQMEAALK